VPSRPKQPCARPGCGALVDRGARRIWNRLTGDLGRFKVLRDR
jgi:hypothetical protein